MRLDHDRDVAGPLQNPACGTLRPGTNPAHRDALIDKNLRDVQILAAQPDGGLGIGGSRGHHLVHRLTGRLRRELQHSEGLVHVQPADQVSHAADLHRGHPDVARDGVRAGALPEQRQAAP